ncbi:hypothetical protein GG804_10275 [Sphingomonas histidinilytica]|uniref:hypothetical protein n=1 Tax=Rhizorhabdus histidinilytica TaxID=439228 RepID=UPI001ADB7E50|nr:hypothetical protein [Rhizorhabdus histidinilytica]MBO9377154.1 hypothetical protein [Rhizorhabdus histidinilytica]
MQPLDNSTTSPTPRRRAGARYDANSRVRALTEAESRAFAKIIREIDRIAPAPMTEINKMFGWEG